MSEEEPASFGAFCFFPRCSNTMVAKRETVLDKCFVPGMDPEPPAWSKPRDGEAKVGGAKRGAGVLGLVTVVVTSVGIQGWLPLPGGPVFLEEVDCSGAVVFDRISFVTMFKMSSGSFRQADCRAAHHSCRAWLCRR